ncbi:MAG: alpha-glucan family phosphorylase [Phycisphaerae bacterium]
MAKSLQKRTKNRNRPATQADIRNRLHALAANFHWTWNHDIQRLFASLDPDQWNAFERNPVRLLKSLTDTQFNAFADDPDCLAHLERAESALRTYLDSKTWYDATARGPQKKLKVAYFCAEFAIHESFPQYSGGLGVLAGDHLKSASDLGIPLVAVGLLYRAGYYRQHLTHAGETRAIYPQYDFADWPIQDTGESITLPIGKMKVRAKIWRAQVGRVPLYMLDTDIPQNAPAARKITHALYSGDNEMRIQQEILLGIGGLAALDAMNEAPTVLHLNEGHAAFAALEHVWRLIQKGMGLQTAVRRVRRSTVFTTHTPVPAGHDRFSPQMMQKYFSDWPARLGVSMDDLLWLGREKADAPDESFCMTVLALRLSNHCNGVSKLHGAVSRAMWRHLYDTPESEAKVEDVPIGHVTNGIHARTWLAPEADALYDRWLKPRWIAARPDEDFWRKNAPKIPPVELWALRQTLRARLIHYVRAHIAEQRTRRHRPANEIAQAWTMFDENALTIGFARRFATYKRAPLIFRDQKRLAAILNNPRRPVQLVFAGKAHPADAGGQAFAQTIQQMSQKPAFANRVILLEDYDMQTGRIMTAGCDVWLNNPERPREASGTSGMKPPLHGGINCSILDGWWPESFDGSNGWAIDDGTTEGGGPKIDKRDATRIYQLLESSIVPTFYQRDRNGLPQKWIKMMIASMATVCGEFNTHRMLADYLRDYYFPAQK